MISDKHANFIVNVGDAQARDVIGLMNLIREKVRDAHGIKLDAEVRIIGEDAEE
jgi:UDP-N-acetylmuramate dehydrogenase